MKDIVCSVNVWQHICLSFAPTYRLHNFLESVTCCRYFPMSLLAKMIKKPFLALRTIVMKIVV